MNIQKYLLREKTVKTTNVFLIFLGLKFKEIFGFLLALIAGVVCGLAVTFVTLFIAIGLCIIVGICLDFLFDIGYYLGNCYPKESIYFGLGTLALVSVVPVKRFLQNNWEEAKRISNKRKLVDKS